MRPVKKVVTLVAALLGFALLLVRPAMGHHSTAMYDSDHPVELAGTVVAWQFTNPHVFLILDVTGDDGQTTTWTLEGLSPNVIVRQGWTPNSLKPGDKLMATVRPLHSGEPGGNYSNLRWEDGTPFDPQVARPGN